MDYPAPFRYASCQARRPVTLYGYSVEFGVGKGRKTMGRCMAELPISQRTPIREKAICSSCKAAGHTVPAKP